MQPEQKAGGTLSSARLERIVASCPKAEPPLPITHITKVANARSIFEKGVLETSTCKVMNESLLYFFYGRAEYRVPGLFASDLEAEKPICFVIPSLNDEHVYSTFPFDSGAFYMTNGIREKYFPYLSDVLDLSLGDNVASIQKLVMKFFGGNDNYLDNRPSNIDYDPLIDLEVASYVQLLARGGLDVLDGRSVTPEIAVHTSIHLTQVQYVIAPLQIKRSTFFMTKCAEYDIVPIYYNVTTPMRPNEYISVIQDRVRGLL